MPDVSMRLALLDLDLDLVLRFLAMEMSPFCGTGQRPTCGFGSTLFIARSGRVAGTRFHVQQVQANPSAACRGKIRARIEILRHGLPRRAGSTMSRTQLCSYVSRASA